MKRLLIKLLIIFSIVISPLVIFFSYSSKQENIYKDTYYGELVDKIERLKEINTKKIIFIGGSSLAFGIRSDEIKKACGYEVVNFGLYAGIGTLPMIDLAKDYINKDDIVILAPELEEQTYSTYYNYNMLHKALEHNYFYIHNFSYSNKLKMFYNYFSYVIEKNKIGDLNNQKPYSKDSFNEYGDINVDFELNNIFSSLYDTTQIIRPSLKLIDDDFIKYVNKFNRYVKLKKAKMYFAYSPSNLLAIDKTSIIEFEECLKDKLDFEILGHVEDYIYDPLYFYDTNYHLNYNGSFIHSAKLSKLINEKNNYKSSYNIPSKAPLSPKYSNGEIVEDDLFILEKSNNLYYINGIKEEYKNTLTSLYIPNNINGINVIKINEGAFKDMENLRVVKFGSNIEALDGKVFVNCPNLTTIYFEGSAPSVGIGILDECNKNAIIYVKSRYINSYLSGYTWMEYKAKIKSY